MNNTTTYRVYDITWDTDGDVSLPNEVFVTLPEEEQVDFNAAIDAASDKVGYCIKHASVYEVQP